jgi:hypothetical protein
MFGTLDSHIETHLVNSKVTDRVYGCGPVTAGNLMVINFVRGIQAQSRDIMKDLVKRIAGGVI